MAWEGKNAKDIRGIDDKPFKLCKDCKFAGVRTDGDMRTWVCNAASEYYFVSPVTGDCLAGFISDCATQRFGGFCGIEGRLWSPASEEGDEG